jgi:hypothetical protein
MAGGQSRGLIIGARMRGWDPTKIQGAEGERDVDISNWDYDALKPGKGGNMGFRSAGRMPGGLGDAETKVFADATETPINPDSEITWNAPKRRGEER